MLNSFLIDINRNIFDFQAKINHIEKPIIEEEPTIPEIVYEYNNLEIDFVTYIGNKIIPIEVKSGRNTKGISIKNIVEKEKLEYGIIFSMNNINCNNPNVKFLPLYTVIFVK